MAAALRRVLCPPLLCRARFGIVGLGHVRHFSKEPKDDVDPLPEGAVAVNDEAAAAGGGKRHADPFKAYAEYLRETLTAKYLANQPAAHPHALCKKVPKNLTMEQQRILYARRVSELRKKYANEVRKKKAAKESFDKQEREKILLAKEHRLLVKKEKSAQRALEIEAEMQVLQAKLASERAEKRTYRRATDLKIEERRLKKKDLVRQQSGLWIEEKDLEVRIIGAMSRPVTL